MDRTVLKRNIKSQKVCEKCSVSLAREMQGQNYIEILSHPSQNGCHQENKNNKCGGHGGTLYTLLASRSISAVTMEISIVVSQKTKNRNTI
jgi:hypothetical protein